MCHLLCRVAGASPAAGGDEGAVDAEESERRRGDGEGVVEEGEDEGEEGSGRSGMSILGEVDLLRLFNDGGK